MAKFTVRIVETLSRDVEVEAASEDEAIQKIEKKYTDAEIVLDSSDHSGTDMEIVK